jgi:RNA polymerase sigma-70 factor (ECF subfamily)
MTPGATGNLEGPALRMEHRDGMQSRARAEAVEPSDEELLERIAVRDQGAFESLYLRHSDLVYSIALRVVADPGIAQDVAQEVFLRVWRHPSLFDVSRGRFVSWLMSVARNRAVDEVRSRGRRRLREVTPAPGADDPADPQAIDPQVAAQLSAERDAVRLAMDSLPDEQRLAIELAYFGGMTQQEIASVLDTPLGTVKTRVRLAMKKLRVSLGDQYGPEPVG